MIIEDYVSFETAKLLKEKGFDEPCYAYWHEDENRLIISQSMHAIQNITNPCFFGPSAPTIQMAMKWLRKKHFLFIDIDPLIGYKWSWSIWLMNDPTQKMGESLEVFSTYKEAADAAIKYCLNNLI